MNTPQSDRKDRAAIHRLAHHKALESLRGVKCTKTGLQIWRHLRKIETALSKAAENCCNEPQYDEEYWESEKNKARRGIVAALGREPEGLYLNSAPRGYALKLDAEIRGGLPPGMEKDWGGYGILAPVID